MSFLNKKSSMLLSMSILAGIAAFSPLNLTYAAETTANDTAAVDAGQTREVVVTATRTEAEVKTVPNTVEVITSEDIKKIGATDVYSALRLADNVNIIKTTTGRKISIRSMDTNQGLILVNGHRVAGEDTPTLQNSSVLNRINIANVERIEIIRGAASAQYGSDALSGVINIITKKSTSAEPTVTVGANTGTESMNNYYNIDFGKQGNFSGTLNVNFGKDRNVMPADGGVGYFFGPNQSYDFSGTWDLDDNHSLTLDASYYKSKQRANWVDSMKAMADGMISALPPFAANKVEANLKGFDYYGKMNTSQKDFSLTYDGKTDNSNYSIRTYYSHLNKYRMLPYEAILAYVGSAFSGKTPQIGENNEYTIWGLEGHDTVQINDNHLLTFGGDYNKYTVEGDNIGDSTSSKDTTTYAGYIQDEWMVNDKLLLIPAVRYDHHSDFGSKTTPKIGMTYFLNDNSRFKANWGKGFKAPTVTDLYSDYYHAGSTILGNPDLRPEESTTWDISYEAEANGNFGKLTYFNNKVDNMISTRDVAGLKSTTEYYNIDGTTKTNGIELTLGRHFDDNWTLKLNSNWTNADNRTASAATSEGGHEVDGIADNITTLQLDYDDNNDYGYSVSLWNQWFSNNYDGSSKKAYTYNTTNFVVNKKLGEGNRIYAGVDNIFNTKIDAFNLDGRIWRVGAEWTF